MYNIHKKNKMQNVIKKRIVVIWEKIRNQRMIQEKILNKNVNKYISTKIYTVHQNKN